jgi:hypothetical protein
MEIEKTSKTRSNPTPSATSISWEIEGFWMKKGSKTANCQ